MRGERVDLNSIRDAVNEDRESFKAKAEKWSSEVRQSAQQFGDKAREFGQAVGSQAKTFANEAGPVARSAGSGIGHVIGVLFKAFFLFIAGIGALLLFGLLMFLLFGGFAVFPLKEFFLHGFWQNALAWCTLLLFLGIPIVALLTWLIRRIAGVRSKNRYLGFVFGGLWSVGLVSAIFLSALVSRDFKRPNSVEENISVIQPRENKLMVDVANTYRMNYYESDWFGLDMDNWPFYATNPDTLMVNSIRVDVVKSSDTAYHATVIKIAQGSTPDDARIQAEKIRFDVSQESGILKLPRAFAVSRYDKYRVQRVLVIIKVPVGKRIELDRSLSRYKWFNLNFNRRGDWEFEETWGRRSWLETGKEYIMTENDGAKKVSDLDQKALKSGRIKLKIKDDKMDLDVQGEFNDTNTHTKDEQGQTDTAKDYRYRPGRENKEKKKENNKPEDKKPSVAKDSVNQI